MTDTGVDALFRRYRPDLQQFFMRRVDSAETAAELTQETFFRLLRTEPAPFYSDPRAYLFRIARNLVTDHYRSARNRYVTPVFEEDWQRFRDPQPNAEAVVLSREELDILQQAVNDLPHRAREVFLLHKVEGLSYAEIAARLGIAKNTVMVHMFRSLAYCKKRLDEYRCGDSAG